MLDRHRAQIDAMRQRATERIVADMVEKGVIDPTTSRDVLAKSPDVIAKIRQRITLTTIVGYLFLDPKDLGDRDHILIEDEEEIRRVTASWRYGTPCDPAPGRVCVITIVN